MVHQQQAFLEVNEKSEAFVHITVHNQHLQFDLLNTNSVAVSADPKQLIDDLNQRTT